MKRFYFALLFCVFTFSTFAMDSVPVSFKIAYLNKDSIIKSNIQVEKINAEYSALETEYEVELNIMISKYNERVKKYLEQGQEQNITIRNARQAEITEIELRIDSYKKSYTKALLEFKTQKMEPIIKAMNDAITLVAKKYNINMVLDITTPLYVDETCIDITSDVISTMTLN